MIKVIGFLILFISGYWLAEGFDFSLFVWFIFGILITFIEEILSHCVFVYRENHNDRKRY
jgi:hypothetical protein